MSSREARNRAGRLAVDLSEQELALVEDWLDRIEELVELLAGHSVELPLLAKGLVEQRAQRLDVGVPALLVCSGSTCLTDTVRLLGEVSRKEVRPRPHPTPSPTAGEF